MGRKPKISFYDEVCKRFGFLVQEFGANEPLQSDRLIPRVKYDGGSFAYSVNLDERSVIVGVQRMIGDGVYLSADLVEIVWVAGLAPRQRVLSSAGTSAAMMSALDSQAHWTKVVHPIVVGDGGIELLGRAR